MAPEKQKKASVPGVADGAEPLGVPLDPSLSVVDRIKTWTQGFPGWGSELFQNNMQVLSASSSPVGTVTFSYTVQPEHCNRLGNLHGGCQATIFDFATTCALAPIAKKGYWEYAGVSRTLNVTYLRPIPEGEKVLVECEVIHAGKRLCSLKGTMKRQSDGAVLAICEHGKVSIEPKL